MLDYALSKHCAKPVGRAVLCPPNAWVDRRRHARSDAPYPHCLLTAQSHFHATLHLNSPRGGVWSRHAVSKQSSFPCSQCGTPRPAFRFAGKKRGPDCEKIRPLQDDGHLTAGVATAVVPVAVVACRAGATAHRVDLDKFTLFKLQDRRPGALCDCFVAAMAAAIPIQRLPNTNSASLDNVKPLSVESPLDAVAVHMP